jgi:signal transduction histidine kinase
MILPFLLLGIVAAAFAWQVERLSAAAAAVARATAVTALANDVHRQIADQETSLRGYLMHEDRVYLDPYKQARPEEAIDALERQVRANGEPVEPVQRLRESYRQWKTHAIASLDDPDAGRSRVEMRARKGEMEGIRRMVGDLLREESSRTAALTRAAATETKVTVLGAVAALVALGVAVTLLTRRSFGNVVTAYDDALARRDEAIAEERAARTEAQEALRLKDEFLSTLSHELRTPLTTILGWSVVLLERRPPPEVQGRALAAIRKNAQAQAQIVDDILDVSRIVSGKIRLHVAVVDACAVVQDARETVRFQAASKAVGIAVRCEEGPVSVSGDHERLVQVVWNLLSNAVKFTPAHGHVDVRVGREDGGVVIVVGDDGEGIPADFLPLVFERFRQADGSRTRPHGGLGLGLSIVKHFVELHGGTVRAESEGPGKGSRFTVWLPEATARESAAEAVQEPAGGPVAEGPRSDVD